MSQSTKQQILPLTAMKTPNYVRIHLMHHD